MKTGRTQRFSTLSLPPVPGAPFPGATESVQLGRYVVLGTLGRGGMGTVLEAFDRTLDRRVALKVLRSSSDKQTQWLMREAQAMARLSHPNVVQVYEVGQSRGQAFVAMELVKGQTLRAWMQQPSRPTWRQCVEVFIQLGEGLAAAHAQGLVHRDFKPGNAIIDDQGRARVLDFGLARAAADEFQESVESTSVMGSQSALSSSLTETGIVMGTPAYMAPEQFQGLTVDARSDQFSFCVTLWEALYERRPYEGESFEVLLRAIRNGRVPPAPEGTRVPGGLRRVLLRGLLPKREQRWPSMDALLAELRRQLVPRRRVQWVLSGVLMLGFTGLGARVYQASVERQTEQAQGAQRCTGARAQLHGVWDDDRRQHVQAAMLVVTAVPYAADTWRRVEPRLDAYADAWVEQYTEACEATTVRKEQSEETMDRWIDRRMDRRMACLHDRRQHLRATVDELSRADAVVTRNAEHAVASLPRLQGCADVDALVADVPPPDDPAMAARVTRLDEQLVVANAKLEAGKYDEGLAVADAVAAEAETIDHEPLMARAWMHRGLLEAATGDYEQAAATLERAYGAALAQQMMAEAARASAHLVYVQGALLVRYDEALHWAANAEPLSRAAGTDEARALYLNNLGSVVRGHGELQEARELHQQALALRERTLGSRHPSVAASLSELGLVAHEYEELEEARELYQRALELRERALGPQHPEVASSLTNLGMVAQLQGKREEACGLYQRASSVMNAALGPEHPRISIILTRLGGLARDLGHLDDARRSLQRALEIGNKVLGPDDPNVATTLTTLGSVLLDLRRPTDALVVLERALAIQTNLEIPPISLAQTRFELARALWAVSVQGAREGVRHGGRDRVRARALARQARRAWAGVDSDAPAIRRNRKAVGAWLAAHHVRRGRS
ncbi:MAG: serine/threonine-protein kinase [Myxococcota bacterium]